MHQHFFLETATTSVVLWRESRGPRPNKKTRPQQEPGYYYALRRVPAPLIHLFFSYIYKAILKNNLFLGCL